jgi:hypothetical protein
MNRFALLCSAVAVASACSSSGRTSRGDGGGDFDLGGATDLGGGTDDGFIYVPPDDGMLVVQDPKDCAEAAANKSYIGCDYWPTVTANAVWSVFDFAVVVSNPGTDPATVTVTGPNSVNQMVTVMPGTVQKIALPWVPELKGADSNECGSSMPLSASVSKTGGAYHLVSSVPVLVYQFNALQYKAGSGGKWATCPGTTTVCKPPAGNNQPIGCFSYSNDASLLLPSTAMTGNYRVVTTHGVSSLLPGIAPGLRAYFTITATQNGTTVKVKASANSDIAAGNGVAAIARNTSRDFTLNAGDVLELVGGDRTADDLSGSLVQADKPVQVIGGVPCIANPTSACDHVEETVLPAETWGQRYAVTMPTGPKGTRAAATVRFVGNVDGTTLSFDPPVAGAPATLNAGQVVEVDNVSADFVVTGDKAFSVSTLQKSASVVDPGTAMPKGDPSLSSATAIEQYRLKYVFLAPDDYDVSFADVVAPNGATMMLDGAAVTATGTQIGGTGYKVFRIQLGATNGGVHTLVSDLPVGVQVIGYGSFTSYQYPAGLNLLTIAPPPPPIN